MIFFALLVAAVAQAAPTTGQASSFLDQAKMNFARWDTDHDGVLSANEIEIALDDPTNKGPAGAAAAALRRAVRASKLPPITIEYLTTAVDHSSDAGDQPKPPAFEKLYEAALKRIEIAHRELFVSGSPRNETVGQGRLGDCFLLAPVGTVAACQPDRLKRMITVLPDGKTSVKFGDGETVELPAPTDGEIVIGASTLNDGVWANVMEKAIGQRMLEKQKTPRHLTPFSIIGVGGTPDKPMAMITGHKLVRVGCEDFQKKGKLVGPEREARLNAVRDALDTAFKTGKLVVGGTADIKAGEVVVPGLYYDHSYGVLGYDRKTDTVTFWNPMGNAYKPKGEPGLAHGFSTSHGRFEVKLPDAVMWFGSFSIETDEPIVKT